MSKSICKEKGIEYMLRKICSRCMHEYDITLGELEEIKNELIIDVRNKREYEEGHIKGSINIPEYEINKNIR